MFHDCVNSLGDFLLCVVSLVVSFYRFAYMDEVCWPSAWLCVLCVFCKFDFALLCALCKFGYALLCAFGVILHIFKHRKFIFLKDIVERCRASIIYVILT